MTLLKRTLDLLLRVFRKRVETIDQFEILASRLPPVVENGRRDATPIGNVNDSSNERSAANNEHLPVTPLHTGVLVDGDKDSLANLAFLDLDAFLLAMRSLAASLFGGGDFFIQSAACLRGQDRNKIKHTNAVRHLGMVKLWGDERWID